MQQELEYIIVNQRRSRGWEDNVFMWLNDRIPRIHKQNIKTKVFTENNQPTNQKFNFWSNSYYYTNQRSFKH